MRHTSCSRSLLSAVLALALGLPALPVHAAPPAPKGKADTRGESRGKTAAPLPGSGNPPQTFLPGLAPLPPVAAKAWLLLDVTSGQAIAALDPDMRVDPASLTKLMTAYLSFQAIRDKKLSLTQEIPISPAAYAAIGSRMFVDINTRVKVEDLLKGMIVQSGNDATIALAEAVGGGAESSFVDLMNREAQRMGLTNTRFRNSSGLPDAEHYSTAKDLSELAVRLIRDFPEFYPLYSQREFTWNNIRQPNRNRLLSMDPTVDGVKTGHTEAAGFCLIASARRDQNAGPGGMQQRRLLSVVLGTGSDTARAQESQKLLNYGFQYSDAVRLYGKDEAAAELQVYKGSSGKLKLGFTQDAWMTVPKGQGEKIKAEVERPAYVIAPVTRGQTIGKLKVSVDGKPLTELPLLALEDVGSAGWFGRLWDAIRLWFK